MAVKHGLREYLHTLSEAELAQVLRVRPDATLAPEPRSLGELANRLSTPYSVGEALGSLNLAGLQLVEAICALDSGSGRGEVHELLGGPTAVPTERLDAELDELRRRALVWEQGKQLHVVGELRAMLPNPMGLGRPAVELLGALTVEQLKAVGARHGLEKLPRKADWVARIVAALADPEDVRRRVAAAAPEVRDIVEQLATDGPLIEGVFFPASYQRVPPGHPGVELALNGWAVPEPWGQLGEMPREVALAIRGEQGRPTLPARPCVTIGAALNPARLLAAGQAAASSSLDGFGRLLALLGHQPLACLQTGGVGVRELKRAAKQVHCRESQVRLWLECAVAAELVWFADGGLLPTEAADAWLAAEPALALATVAEAWWQLPVTASYRVDENGKALPAAGGRLSGPGAGALRAELFDTLGAFAVDTQPVGLDAVIDLLVWRRPLAFGNAETLGPYAAATLAEARELGLAIDHALTPLGRALHSSRHTGADELAAALTGLLPAPTPTATFLPDLTAVVAGAPAAALTALLNGCADTESRDAASIWRFSPVSVRRAFDAGWTADRLLTELGKVTAKSLPQPLAYLVRDVARRHGQLRVRPVASCVCVHDPALAAEVARHRALVALQLTPLADTVLSSVKSAAETLTALRAAGYAPVKQDAAGNAVLEQTKARRVGVPRRRARGGQPAQHRSDPEGLARRLHRGSAAPEPELALGIELPFDLERELDLTLDLEPPFVPGTGAGPETFDELLDVLDSAARQLSPGERTILADSIDRGRPVHIDYLSASGGLTSRVVEPTDLEGHLLVAWCRLREDERNFALGRIAAVSAIDDGAAARR